VVQEKTVRPVGESREERVDVRILSATHRNLSELVAAGRFREDLFYRINVIELRVPPLRERAVDIPDLVTTILERLCRRMKLEPPAISEEAMQALQAYSFPGNVRELENIIERALTLTTSGVITLEHVKLRPAPILAAAMTNGSDLAATLPALNGVGTTGELSPTQPALGEQLEDIERAAIIKALEQTRYNKTAAAKLLGMTFRALRYRIKKLGIE
jgi:two-component system response regulator PilR (NtrC family)